MRKIFITEAQKQYINKALKEEVYQMPVPKKANKPYCINPDKVLIVKKFLDSTFTPHDYEKVGSDGYPTVIKVVSMNAKNGDALKYMFQDQLLDLLIDRFQKMFSDKEERRLFLTQVMKDWLGGKISSFGGLSVNKLNEITTRDLEERTKDINLNPTDPQLEAGNYKKGHISVKGMKIAIENPVGSKRPYTDKDGNKGYVVMKNHYGYFNVTKGKDGDAVDVFIGPSIENFDTVYCIDQKIGGKFDETKVMLGFTSKEEAKAAYLSNYSEGWDGFMYITAVSLPVFKKWLYRGRKQRIPFAKYVEIKKKRIKEISDATKQKLSEDAYIGKNAINRNKKEINISYEKGDVRGKKSKEFSNDFLRTGLMDNGNGTDTYEVPLKGGLTSYNITSINGMEVMHYFKNRFKTNSGNKTMVDVEDEKGRKDAYQLDMEDNEFRDFLDTFLRKVNAVIYYHINKVRQENNNIKFNSVAIYPVPSSSNFNKSMADIIQRNMLPIAGIKKGINVITPDIFNKDLKNLRIDNEFVKNNKKYYDSVAYTDKNGISPTGNQMLNTTMSRLNAFKEAEKCITHLSELAKKIIKVRNTRNSVKKETYEKNLATLYAAYYNTYISVFELGKYFNYEKGKMSNQLEDSLMNKIKYAKGRSVESRSYDTWVTVRPYLRGLKAVDGKPYKQIDVVEWAPKKFEIKKYTDNVRMGLIGYYSKNDEKFAEEADKIKNSIFVIFDDNISGGATLSDICYQAMQCGINKDFIIPITFGQMDKKVTLGLVPIKMPEGGKFNTDFEYN